MKKLKEDGVCAVSAGRRNYRTESAASLFARTRVFGAVFFAVLLFTACASVQRQDRPDFSYIENSAQKFEWTALYPGILISHIRYAEYPLTVHAVKIYLSDPSLRIAVTEPFMFENSGHSVKRETARAFAKRNNTAVSVNAAFFNTKSLLFSKKAEPIGIHIYDKKLLNPPDARYGAVYFTDSGTAVIAEPQSADTIPHNTIYAVSGYKMILKNGRAVKTGIGRREDSRTCAGVADGGKTLILFFAEAENKLKSRGITYDEAAFFMKKLGASDALHLDGGGSSSLVIKEKNKFRTVVPSMPPFGLRKTATNFGFIYEEDFERPVEPDLS